MYFVNIGFSSLTTALVMIFSVSVQGLFVPLARVETGDPLRVLHLFHNKYTGYN